MPPVPVIMRQVVYGVVRRCASTVTDYMSQYKLFSEEMGISRKIWDLLESAFKKILLQYYTTRTTISTNVYIKI